MISNFKRVIKKRLKRLNKKQLDDLWHILIHGANDLSRVCGTQDYCDMTKCPYGKACEIYIEFLSVISDIRAKGV